MKPDELMIGDWVEYGQYITTVRSLSDKIVLSGCIGRLDEVRPVPITTEILENNGWKSYSHERKTIYGIIQGFEITLAYMDYYWQLCVDGTIYRKIKINYVHELQHAMHLMRLHDMANNFKVKGGQQ